MMNEQERIAEIISEDIDEHCGDPCPKGAPPAKKKKDKKEEIVKENDDAVGFESPVQEPEEEGAEEGAEEEGVQGADFEAIASMDHWVDRLGGGFADGRHPAEFDTDQIIKGINVELEHTDCPYTACEIAMDHLAEIDDYYTRLAEMEAEAKAGNSEEGEEEPEGEPEEEGEEEAPAPPFGEDIDRIAEAIIG
jgi:hypothetical protein